MRLEYADIFRELAKKPFSYILIFLGLALAGFYARYQLSRASEYSLSFNSRSVPSIYYKKAETIFNARVGEIIDLESEGLECSLYKGGCFFRRVLTKPLGPQVMHKLRSDLEEGFSAFEVKQNILDTGEFTVVDRVRLRAAADRSDFGIEAFFRLEIAHRFLKADSNLVAEFKLLSITDSALGLEFLFQKYEREDNFPKMSEVQYLISERKLALVNSSVLSMPTNDHIAFDLSFESLDPNALSRSLLFGLILGLFGVALIAVGCLARNTRKC